MFGMVAGGFVDKLGNIVGVSFRFEELIIFCEANFF